VWRIKATALEVSMFWVQTIGRHGFSCYNDSKITPNPGRTGEDAFGVPQL
jgi:hypothetical protein